MNYGKLSSMSLIKISGDDASSFLQGQLSNDVTTLNQNWQLTGYCNPKGRLLGLLKLWRDAEGNFYALTASDLSESIAKRLRMYVMRSQVVIDELNSKGIEGFETFQDLDSKNPELVHLIDPKIDNQLIQHKAVTALIVNQRAILISDDSDSTYCFDEQWSQLNIDEGLPSIKQATSELFIPQMLNLDLLDGISFKKGCYTGQEVVARLHYLGKLKQRMFVCELITESNDIKSGDKIICIDSENSSTAGHIVTAVKGHTRCLAVLKLESCEKTLSSESGTGLKKLSQQPYEI